MIFTSGLVCPEGPVALKDGSWLCVQGEPAGCITHISADGKVHSVIAVTGRPNGLALDNQGNIWVAESRVPSLLKLTFDGKAETILSSCGDEKFLFPNDLCFGPDGMLYLTDSGVLIDEYAPNGKLRDDYQLVPCDGRVYQINPATKEINKIDTGIRFTNGIAFGKNGFLYANETITGNVFRYDVSTKNIAREYFGNVIDPNAQPGYKGPDGMAFGDDGLLYVTVFGQKDITVLNKDGSLNKRIETVGSRPSNIAFGLPGSKKIYVTEYEFGNIEMFDVDTDGLPLFE